MKICRSILVDCRTPNECVRFPFRLEHSLKVSQSQDVEDEKTALVEQFTAIAASKKELDDANRVLLTQLNVIKQQLMEHAEHRSKLAVSIL